MENAVKALEYAFAVLVFVIALSISMNLLGQAKSASDSMIFSTNPETYYSDVELTATEINANGRIVGVETIIPTLYRDYKENYVIEFYTKDKGIVMRLDLSEENRRREIWTANPNTDVKKRLDILVSGNKNVEVKGMTTYNSTNTYDGIINNQGYTRMNDNALNTEAHPIARYKIKSSYVNKINNGQSDKINNKDYDVITGDELKQSVKDACREIIDNGLYSYCKGRQFVEEYAYLLSEKTYENERLVERIDKIVIRYFECELSY